MGRRQREIADHNAGLVFWDVEKKILSWMKGSYRVQCRSKNVW